MFVNFPYSDIPRIWLLLTQKIDKQLLSMGVMKHNSIYRTVAICCELLSNNHSVPHTSGAKRMYELTVGYVYPTYNWKKVGTLQ